jgi:hypothetical protein
MVDVLLVAVLVLDVHGVQALGSILLTSIAAENSPDRS